MRDLLEFKFAPIAERFPAGAGRRIFSASDEKTTYYDDGQTWRVFAGQLYDTITAREYLPPFSAVNADGTRAKAGDVPLGFTLAGGLIGQTVKVWKDGSWTNTNWHWTAGLPVYLDSAGDFTQAPDGVQVGVAFSHQGMVWKQQIFDPDRILTLAGEVLVLDGNVLCNFLS